MITFLRINSPSPYIFLPYQHPCNLQRAKMSLLGILNQLLGFLMNHNKIILGKATYVIVFSRGYFRNGYNTRSW